ncbi:MAG TPA: hypothetical protein VF526_11565, partial [Solirubrobacteraceae bacterium]
LIAGIEQVLKRKVTAFLSANHIDPDIAIETFILAPGDQAAPTVTARRHADDVIARRSGLTARTLTSRGWQRTLSHRVNVNATMRA